MFNRKEIAIAAQKELQRIDGEISKLAADRTKVANILKACEIDGKMAAAVNAAHAHAHIAMFDVEQPKEETPRATVLRMFRTNREITPKDLADEAKISGAYASMVLTKMADEKVLKRIKRGVYAMKLKS